MAGARLLGYRTLVATSSPDNAAARKVFECITRASTATWQDGRIWLSAQLGIEVIAGAGEIREGRPRLIG